MKKLLCLLSLLLAFSLTACSSNEEKSDDPVSKNEDVDTSLVGVWYLNGDSSSEHYIKLNADGSYEMNVEDDIEEGKYTVGECNNAAPQVNNTVVGESFVTSQVEFDDIYLYTDGTLVANQCAMISNDEYYILDSAIADQDVYLMANLVARAWKNKDDSNERYYFYLNNSVAYTSNVEDEVTDHVGTWTLERDTLTITWETGETKSGVLEKEGAHAIMSFDGEEKTFSNKVSWED